MTAISTFTTERLLLRGVLLSDAAAYQKNFADCEVIKYLSSAVPWPYPENGAEFFIKNIVLPNQGKDRWNWGIFLKENPSELVGAVELFRPGKPENRGFWLAKKHWGKGYMTEAVRPVMDYAFTNLGFEKMVFANAVENTKSRRVKEKTGARFLEVKPANFVNPEITHSEYWELTKEEWQGP